MPTEEEILRDSMMADTYPKAEAVQEVGRWVGLTPPIFPPFGPAIQTAGDVIYTAGAGYQALQGVPGKAAETAGGVASIINPFPTPKLSLAKGSDRAFRKLPMTNAQAMAAADYGYSQGVQEVGEAVGGYQEQDEAFDRMLRDSMAGSGIVPAEEPAPEPEPKPKPSYRVMSVDPKQGDIDEMFALIETGKDYGAPASDPTMRRIRVGDELPEGSVTEITSEGIRVTPPEEGAPEYVIPLGGREGYKPPEPKKEGYAVRAARAISNASEGLPALYAYEAEEPNFSEQMDDRHEEAYSRYQEYLNEAAQEQGKFYDTDDPNEIIDMVQEDFATSFEDDKTLEMTQTPDGMIFLFQDEDGNISSYFQDYEGDAIRTTPAPETVSAYEAPVDPRERLGMTAFEELMQERNRLKMAGIQAAADSL